MSDSPSAPPPADYRGAAQETAEGNLANIRAQTKSNRYNQYTPYGSQTWNQPDAENKPDTWESTIALDPRAQEALDTQLAASNQIGSMSQAAGDRTKVAFDKPFDSQSVDDVYNRSYANQTSRLDPQWSQNQKMFDAKMSNKGIFEGSEAYGNAARTFGQNKNDAYQQAQNAAIATMPQTYQLATSARNQPLNEWNAIRTGTQIQNPTFGPTPGAGYTPGADQLGAAQGEYGGALNIYNAQVGASNSANAATGTAVSGVAMAAAAYMF
tara:strand:- start:3397 stop:4200 length:804 start_codon:yes stop_codon:yes gene_type:complete